MRQDAGEVEAAGVERARAVVASADLVLWLADGSAADPMLPCPASGLVIPVLCKADLAAERGWGEHPDFGDAVVVSALDGRGMPALQRAIVVALTELSEAQLAGSNAVLTRERHAANLLLAADNLRSAAQTLADALPLELAAADLRDASEMLARVTGEIAPEHVLQSIFSRFCIGK
jgi:tRNA modification GTPase